MAPRESLVFVAHCSACRRDHRWRPAEALAQLQTLGMLRRQKEPDLATLAELVVATAARLACPDCGRQGMTMSSQVESDADWELQRRCQGCGQPIPLQRLQARLDVRLCVACQERHEQGRDDAVPEYCPRCGSIMRLEMRRTSGISRYALVCPACRRTA